jgi:hypothetical protein
MEATYGSDVWKQRMEVTYGSDVWKRPLLKKNGRRS